MDVFDPEYELYVSASQLSTWRLCNRKWWLEKMACAVTEDKGYFTFGTVLHAVLERWLRADDRGVDPGTGEPVELYPEDWHKAEDSGVPVSLAEQLLIKKLVTKAIDEGIVRRLPGREIEAEFSRTLVDDVGIVGFIDVALPGGVEDHKSIGNFRYALGPEQLQQDPQLLLYLHEGILRLEEAGKPVPDKMFVRHNQFGKDTKRPRVTFAEGWVKPDAARKAWAEAQRDAAVMLEQSRTLTHWTEAPEPPTAGQACRKYGGCDFIDICTGRRTITEHNAHTETLNSYRSQLSHRS